MYAVLRLDKGVFVFVMVDCCLLYAEVGGIWSLLKACVYLR